MNKEDDPKGILEWMDKFCHNGELEKIIKKKKKKKIYKKKKKKQFLEKFMIGVN